MAAWCWESFHEYVERLERKPSSASASSLMHSHSIFRVPRQLRDVHPQAYDPLVICLGPYRKPRRMEPSFTETFLSLSSASLLLRLRRLPPSQFPHLASSIVSPLLETLAFYERPPPYDPPLTLTFLLAADACFVSCFLLHLASPHASSFPALTSDLKLPARLVDSIVRDLLLLENQLPLSLLVRTALLLVEHDGEDALAESLQYMINRVNPFHSELVPRNEKFSLEANHHILECLYSEMMRIMGQEKEDGEEDWRIDMEEENLEMQVIESAVHLRRAGIQFKVCSSADMQSRIYFHEKCATLFLPQIRINPESESLLRNVAAYEIIALQRAELCSYLALMDDLIDTAEDVEVLRSSGVLIHCLRNDKEVANLWNSMSKNLQVLYEPNMMKKAYVGMKRHLRKKRRYKMLWELYAAFSNRYLSAPWLIASVLAATFLLLLTVIQTSYTAATYYKA